MTEGEIGCVVSAKAAACDCYAVTAGFAGGPGYDLFQDEPIIEGLIPGAVGRRDCLIVPTVGVEAVGAVNLDLPVLEEPPGGLDQAHVFVLVVGALGGREEDQGVTGVTEYEHFEVPVDDRGVPFMIFFAQIHSASQF